MLDIKWIINNPKKADEEFARRGLKPLSSKLIKLSKSRSSSFIEVEKLLQERNKLSDLVPKENDVVKKNLIIKKVKNLKKQINNLQNDKSSSNSDLHKILLELPNFLDEKTPSGKSEDENKEIKKVGNIKNFDFKIKDHVEIGENLDLLDFKTAAKVSASRFVY